MAGSPRAHSPGSPPSPENFVLSPNVALSVEAFMEEAEEPVQKEMEKLKEENRNLKEDITSMKKKMEEGWGEKDKEGRGGEERNRWEERLMDGKV